MKRAKPTSAMLAASVCLVISALLTYRFILMIFFPGTEATRLLFNFFVPWWDLFSTLTLMLRMPVQILSDLLTPTLPASTRSWFPEMGAARFFSALSDTPGALHVEIYPGKIEWLTLLAIPFWWVFIGALHISIWRLIDARKAFSGYESEIPVRMQPDPPPTRNQQMKLPPPRTAAQTETSATEAAPPPKESAPVYKDRLSQVKATPTDVPGVIRRYDTSREAWNTFKQQEGDMMVRDMVRSLQEENRNLQHQQQQLRSTFSQYFSPNVLRYLEENKTAFQNIENQKREITVMFCDIRGFSAFTQSATSQQVVDFLSEYFDIASYVILHRYDGVISKLMGDGLMAYWGFPMPMEDHAKVATQAALQILREVDLRNKTRPDAPPLNIGIGIATGEAIVGNIGSNDFKDFTLLGVPVNLASRLDEANKQLNTSLLISAQTFQALQGGVPCRDMGEIQLRGWQGTERLFAPRVDLV